MASHVSGGSVHFRRVFAGESTAAVASTTAIGVDDDFTASQATVTIRATDFEAAGWIDVNLDIVFPNSRFCLAGRWHDHELAFDQVRAIGFENGLDQLGENFMTGCIAEVIFAIFGFFDAGVVLGGEYNGFDSERGSVSQILNGHLAFGVRASPCQNAFAAQAGVFIHEPVRNGDRQRHEFRSFVAGETEHHPLVAGTFFIHTLGDVRALGVNVAIDLDGGVSEPDFRVGVADFFHHVANNFVHSFTGQRGFCRNLTGNKGQIGRNQCFASHATCRVVRQTEVQNRVADLVGDFIRMAHGNRFAGEQITVGRGHFGSRSASQGPKIRCRMLKNGSNDLSKA